MKVQDGSVISQKYKNKEYWDGIEKNIKRLFGCVSKKVGKNRKMNF